MDLYSALAAIFGGAGAVVLWEMVVRPLRVRREFSEILLTELSLNSSILGSAAAHAQHNQIDPAFRVSTKLYDLNSASLVALPAGLAGRVVNLYFLLANLNELPQRYEEYLDTLRATKDPELQQQIAGETQAVIARFNYRVRDVLERMGPIQTTLYRLAYPLWSPRAMKKPSLEEDTLEEIAARVAKATSSRRDLMANLKSKSDENG